MGALQELEAASPSPLIQTVTGLGGTSSGGFFAALCVLANLNVREVTETMQRLRLDLFDLSLTAKNIQRCIYEFGMVQRDDAPVRATLEATVVRYTGSSATTLAELAVIRPQLRLRLVTVDLFTGARIILDAESAAEMKLTDALWATMAIPWAMKPLRWGPWLLVDGGLVAHMAYDMFPQVPAGTTANVSIYSPYAESTDEYINVLRRSFPSTASTTTSTTARGATVNADADATLTIHMAMFQCALMIPTAHMRLRQSLPVLAQPGAIMAQVARFPMPIGFLETDASPFARDATVRLGRQTMRDALSASVLYFFIARLLAFCDTRSRPFGQGVQ